MSETLKKIQTFKIRFNTTCFTVLILTSFVTVLLCAWLGRDVEIYQRIGIISRIDYNASSHGHSEYYRLTMSNGSVQKINDIGSIQLGDTFKWEERAIVGRKNKKMDFFFLSISSLLFLFSGIFASDVIGIHYIKGKLYIVKCVKQDKYTFNSTLKVFQWKEQVYYNPNLLRYSTISISNGLNDYYHFIETLKIN